MKQLPLGGKRGANQFVMVDDDVFAWASKLRWCLSSEGYAVRNNWPNGTSYLHREILQAKQGQSVDHRNHNPLDCQRENLRFANKSQNGMNIPKYAGRSKYKGAYHHSINHSWVAQIRTNRKSVYIGSFSEERWAAMAYDIWAKELHGEFAVLNF